MRVLERHQLSSMYYGQVPDSDEDSDSAMME
jgi:hypothetical protein